MTWRSVYGVCFCFFLVATALTLASICIPDWITWDVGNETPQDPNLPTHRMRLTYGLHRRCSSLDDTCTSFPRWDECHDPNDRSFCSKWRTTGFFVNVAAVVEFATLIAFGVTLLGGKQKRQDGWKTIGFFLFVAALCQIVAMSIISHLFENDERFFPQWKLDICFYMCVASWAVQILVAVALGVTAFSLPEEGGYELIPGRNVP